MLIANEANFISGQVHCHCDNSGLVYSIKKLINMHRHESMFNREPIPLPIIELLYLLRAVCIPCGIHDSVDPVVYTMVYTLWYTRWCRPSGTCMHDGVDPVVYTMV